MEALVEHCVHEIAHDGDLGSTLSRVGAFMNEYYARNPSDEQRSTFQMLFDVLRNEPHIVVGLAPAPNVDVLVRQPDKLLRRGGPTSKKPLSQASTSQPPPEPTPVEDAEDVSEGLQLIPGVANVPAMDLVSTYGERLRVAVDPEFACYTLTGMPNRQMPRSNPRMYTCLQFIARARKTGVNADTLAAATGYDQKICYHHIRHLVSLNLIFKVRKNDLTRVDYCIHRAFRDAIPPEWTVRSGKLEATQDASARGSVADDAEFESDSERLDPKHEASPRLLRERVLAVLKENSSPVPLNQLFASVGYKDARATEGADWDFFCLTVEEMVSDEDVVKALKKIPPASPVLCVRLPSDEPPDPVAARMQLSRMRHRRVNNSMAVDEDDSNPDGTPGAGGKRAADEPPGGEPPVKRKRGRPRKEDVVARAPAPETKPAKKDEPPRDPSPPWASKRRGGPRPPSPIWTPKRFPTPPWMEGDRPGRPKTPPPVPLRHTPKTLGQMDISQQTAFATSMIAQLEQYNESLAAGSGLLTPADLRTLLPGELPNRAVVDGLNNMMMRTTKTIDNVCIAPSILYKYILEAKGVEGTKNPNEARLWAKVLKMQETINMFALHRFVIPIRLTNHWICACVDFKASMISIYDSIVRSPELTHTSTIRVTQALSTWLDYEAKARNHAGPDWKLWKADSTPKDVVKSDTVSDTGFYTWMFARALVMSERPNMNIHVNVASERVWLIVDGIQSLPHVSSPPPPPQQQQQPRSVAHHMGQAPPLQAPPPPPPSSSRQPAPGPSNKPPNSHRAPPPGPLPSGQGPQQRPPTSRPAAPPGQRPPPPPPPQPYPYPQQNPSPAPSSSAGSRPSPDVMTRPRQGSSASLASLPSPVVAVGTRPRQGSGAHPSPSHPLQLQHPSHLPPQAHHQPQPAQPQRIPRQPPPTNAPPNAHASRRPSQSQPQALDHGPPSH